MKRSKMGKVTKWMVSCLLIMALAITPLTYANATVADYYDAGWRVVDGAYVNSALAPVSGVIARGIDVSRWQGAINWPAVAADGVSFAFVRIGSTREGIDPTFGMNMQGASASGIRTGIYLYSYAMSPEEAAAEANFVLANIQDYTVSFPIAIDLECAQQGTKTPEELAAIANAFCAVIDNAGFYPIVYANKNWFTNRIGEIGYDRWVAQYGTSCTYPSFTVWQTTSHGSVGGVNGRVDVNYLFKDYFSLIIPDGFVARGGNTYFYKNYRMQTGWVEAAGSKYYMDASGHMQTGWINLEGSGTYYLKENGAMAVGFTQIGENRYYFDANGIMQRGIVEVNGAKYYLDETGIMHTGWINGYYFRETGEMVTGWADIGTDRYYFNENGQVTVGMNVIENNQYLFNESGIMQKGWITNGTTSYYFDTNGVMQKGWITVENKTYYLGDDGVVKTGLVTIGDGTYLFDATGVRQYGFSTNGTSTYYFLADGKMAKDWNLVDGAWYYFGTDGIMKTGVINISGNIFYSDAQGKMVVNTWENIGQRWFFFGGNGIMVSNTTLAIKGVTYQFDASGVMVAPAGITPVQ